MVSGGGKISAIRDFDFAVSLRGEGSGWGAETLPMACIKKASPQPKV